MVSFGIIAEGPTDQTVIENILIGFLSDESEPAVNFVQPPRPLEDVAGGWGNLLQSLSQGDCEAALAFNDFVIVHVDTDIQEDAGFDVPRRAEGRELELPERVDAVIERLRQEIDSTFFQANQDRILFAIAVDSIECWLLPLLYSDNKVRKTTGCLDAANRALGRADRALLEAHGKKFLDAYESASAPYRKKRTLLQEGPKNPSLGLFLQRLGALRPAIGE